MSTQPEALRLADELDKEQRHLYATYQSETMFCPEAAELRRLHHNNLVLTDALWKACGDNEEVVNATIESQGELK